MNVKMKEDLLQKAVEAAKESYSPYSLFPVGAAVLTKKGSVFLGTNVENASYGQTICAEQAAIANAVVNGDREIVAIAVYSPKGDITPCGACRQVIAEFGHKIQIISTMNGNIVSCNISEMLPYMFSKEDLRK